MNYIINNSKLKELLSDYLNNRTINNLSRVDTFIIIYQPIPDDNHDDEPIAIEYDNYDGRLYINKDFLISFHSFFPFGIENLKEFIKDWFESKFKVGVTFVESGI